MALNDALPLVPSTGFVFTAPAETVIPASLTNPAGPWENIGHTSYEDGITLTRDGGDSEVLPTFQNKALRERRDPTTLAITIVLYQWDNNVLGMYFGPGNISVSNQFGVIDPSATTVKALYVRIVDGATNAGFYVPKVSIGAEDDIELDPETFLGLPIRATVLQVSGQDLITFVGDELGAA